MNRIIAIAIAGLLTGCALHHEGTETVSVTLEYERQVEASPWRLCAPWPVDTVDEPRRILVIEADEGLVEVTSRVNGSSRAVVTVLEAGDWIPVDDRIVCVESVGEWARVVGEAEVTR